MELSAKELRIFGINIVNEAPSDNEENALAALDEARWLITNYVFKKRGPEEPDQTPKA